MKESNQPTLFLMFGYPGAGKTTAAKLIEELIGAVRLSSDDVRLELFPQPAYTQAEHDTVYKTLDLRAKKHLEAGKSVVYDANLNRYMHRLEKYELCEHIKAKAVLIWIQAPRDIARTRAVLRGHHHLVPKDETFESMFDRVAGTLEEPREDEPVYRLDGNHIDRSVMTELLDRL